MKRLFYALGAIIIIAAIIISGVITVKNTADDMLGIFDEINIAVQTGKTAQAAVLTAQAEDMWVNAEKKLKLFVNHSDICDIGLQIAGMTPLIEKGETAAFLSLFAQARIGLIHIASLENVRCE